MPPDRRQSTGRSMRRRTWYPALAVSISVVALCGCGTGETDFGGSAHQGPEGCGTIRLHGAPARSIAFHVGYVAEPGLLTVPDIRRWYACVARPDGHVVALADGSFDDVDYFSWSPDGDCVLFAAARREWQIYRLPVNGGRPTSLTPAGHSQYSPAVPPDGTLIAYTESTTRDSVWMMENDGSGRRRLRRQTGHAPRSGRQMAGNSHSSAGTSCGCSMSAMAVGESSTGRSPAVDLPGRLTDGGSPTPAPPPICASSHLAMAASAGWGPMTRELCTTMRGGSPPGALTAV